MGNEQDSKDRSHARRENTKWREKVKVNTLNHPGTKLSQREEFLASEKIRLSEENNSDVTSSDESENLGTSPTEEVQQNVMDSWDYLDILGNLPPL